MSQRGPEWLPQNYYEWGVALVLLGGAVVLAGVLLEFGGYEGGLEGGSLGVFVLAVGIYLIVLSRTRSRS